MASPSDDSQPDYDRINERVQHSYREPTPNVQPSERTDADFEAVGAQFGDRRASYPRDLDISDHESNGSQPRSYGEAEPSMAASASAGNGPPLVSSPTTPARANVGPWIQAADYHRERQRSARRNRHRRRGRSGPHSQSSEENPEHPDSNTTIGYSVEQDEGNDRGRTTPTPNFSPSRTPSHRSFEPEEGGYPLVEPESPHPFSAVHRYNPSPGIDAVERIEDRLSGRFDDRESG
ncbi:hypothetical protein CC80DRAFT_132473 [Byssothecium circinans]|uniref:Uncharacterized protein n=1 Tax=Byssothecium circinans TaxID=147558 RepID=A0A6A5TY54_9PLEO|nr:hypothetical protein CC80DRAFT_132473 [Byssothecium circinans]